jgi:hypothetical protein
MDPERVVYRIGEWNDDPILEDVAVSDYADWARQIGFPASLTQDGALAMMRRNARLLLRFQGTALSRGPVFVAPLKGDNFELLGGDVAGTVSRVFNGAVFRYLGDAFPPNYLISPNALDDVLMSGVQVRAACVLARALLDDPSDQDVSELLIKVGVPIARKTVQKYKLEPADKLLPSPRFAQLLERTASEVRGEADLARLVEEMKRHNHAQAALLRGEATNGPWRRAELRDWLEVSRVLDEPSRARFRQLAPGEQRRIIDAVLDALESGLRGAATRGGVRV